MFRDYSVHVTHPRYFGLFNPGVREASIVAETLVATFNPQLAAWSHSPIANEIEQHVLRQFSNLLGFPSTAAFNFCNGGAEANLSAMLVALNHQFPRWRAEGIACLKVTPTIYVSADAHDSLVKAARACGLGDSAIRRVPTTSPRFAVDPDQLELFLVEDLRKGWSPFMIVGTAGTTSTGAVDPLRTLAAIAQKYNAWFHVDAAWGGTAVLSSTLRREVRGIESADSVTWDAHKWLSVPFSAGMFFCRHSASVGSTFSIHTSYMPTGSAETVDPYASTIQWTRRAMGLKVFMSLVELGFDGYRDLIEHQAAMGVLLRERLQGQGFQVVNDTALPVVCFTHPKIRQGQVKTEHVLNTLYSRGRVWISDVRPTGYPEKCLRACITHYETDESDIECLIEELVNALK
jgi:glutamate/tyrosine decarboxylase-like PLP-dependent enzyme